MRASRRTTALVALAPLWATAALAAGDTARGRYTMSPTKDGVVRLDTQTGAMALCQRQNDGWACKDMDDSQSLLLKEIDKLKSENEMLKSEVEDLDKSLGLSDAPSDAPKPAHKFTLPSEEEVDKAFDYLESMLGKLRDRMEKLEKKHGRDDGTEL
jgi:hypothetical protein